MIIYMFLLIIYSNQKNEKEKDILNHTNKNNNYFYNIQQKYFQNESENYFYINKKY